MAPLVASAAISGGAGILSPIVSNLFNQNAAYKDRSYNSLMYNLSTWNNRFDAAKAWERETDYKYIMDQYKKAGINPYAVLGNSVQAPVSHSASAPESKRPGMDLSAFNNAASSIPQLMLMNAQVENIKAQTEKTKAETANVSYDVGYKTKYQGQIAEYTIRNMEATNQNIQQTTSNLQSNQENILQDTNGKMLHNALQTIDLQFKKINAQLEQTGKVISNRHLEAQIQNLQKQSKQIETITSQHQQEIQQASRMNPIHLSKAEQEVLQSIQHTEQESQRSQIMRGERKLMDYNFMSDKLGGHPVPFYKKIFR